MKTRANRQPKNILITGATGNVGLQTIKHLQQFPQKQNLFAAVRNPVKAREKFQDSENLSLTKFDMEDPTTFGPALKDIDIIFLLRPPHISDVEKYFRPLISKIKEAAVEKIVFLSVQGAEKSNIIPHNKIEKLVREYNLEYIFMRPGYFMQNLTTTLLPDIQNKKEIMLPAGKAKFNWIDVNDIGKAAALLLNDFDQYKNNAFEITGYENESFGNVTSLINDICNTDIRYHSVNPLQFYRRRKKEGMEKAYILVMLMLHFIPRFQKEPPISNFYEKLTGEKPTDLSTFIKREKNYFFPSDKS